MVEIRKERSERSVDLSMVENKDLKKLLHSIFAVCGIVGVRERIRYSPCVVSIVAVAVSIVVRERIRKAPLISMEFTKGLACLSLKDVAVGADARVLSLFQSNED